MTVHHLIATHSIEERIAALQDNKRRMARRLLPSGDIDVTQLDDAELLRLCALTARA
ncbi:hypothetical protein [Streptomyces sp. NPDC048442]|uniref:hypothetical protein n=1 Tax=Streptomyces sp. NPDC048442 TaxID=3154823 RepID=UPI00343C45CA